MSNEGNLHVQRAAAGDPTLLHDSLGVAIDELTEIRREVIAVMDAAEPTRAKPGSFAKVEEMRRRAESGQSIFVDKDATKN
jgi:hypothetical protein